MKTNKADETTEMTCEADDAGTCSDNDHKTDSKDTDTDIVPKNEKFQVRIVNKSPHRADIYWDDGKFGLFVVTLDAKTGETPLITHLDHRFFVTRHALKEGLFDPETDQQLRFRASKPDETFLIPESAAPSTNKCQDRYSICKQHAKNGGCWNGPGWMIINCCKSCDAELNSSKLIDPKIRCTKENLNITDPIWKPGDLNKLFSSWATDDKFAMYEPQVLSSPDGKHGGQSGPCVVVFDNFLKPEEADALIRGGKLVGFSRSGNVERMNDVGEMINVARTTRTSSNAWCQGECENLREVQAVTSRVESLTGISQRHYESIQILEYEYNQFYRVHHDNLEQDTRPCGPRIITFFLYLSDVEEGGETYFNELGLTVKPLKGRALVWPDVKDDEPDVLDSRTVHEAKDVVRGKKYAANHWIHLYDFVGPYDWSCTG